jgi:hypothetical protein
MSPVTQVQLLPPPVTRILAALVVSAAIFAGCNAQTEPATNVTKTSFRAHAKVQCDGNERLRTWWERRVVGTAWDRVRYDQSTVFDCPPGGIPPSRSSYTFRASTQTRATNTASAFGNSRQTGTRPSARSVATQPSCVLQTPPATGPWDDVVTLGSWAYPWGSNRLWRRPVPRNPTLDPNSEAMIDHFLANDGHQRATCPTASTASRSYSRARMERATPCDRPEAGLGT